MDEIWREISGYPGFEVSNLGRVRRGGVHFVSKIGRARYSFARVLKPVTTKVSAPGYRLGIPSGRKRFYSAGELVAQAFMPSKPDGHKIVFLDGNPANARLDNLAYEKIVSKEPFVLDEMQVRMFRRAYAEGAYLIDLMREYGLTKRYARGLASGRYYPDIGGVASKPPRRGRRTVDYDLVAARLKRGESPSEIALDLGVTRQAIWRIKKGMK